MELDWRGTVTDETKATSHSISGSAVSLSVSFFTQSMSNHL